MPSSPRTLSTRQLNRTLLRRQGLVRRTRTDPLAMIERLVALQAQVPRDPYVALWSRITRFEPAALAEPMADRRVMRMTLLRGTLHTVTAADALALRPVIQPAIERTVEGSSPLRTVIDRVDRAALLAFVRERLEEQPKTRAQLVTELAERWPKEDADSLGYALYLIPTVQVTPRGIWGKSGASAFTTVRSWIGREPNGTAKPDALMDRYLAAFGPATPADAQMWSGMPRLREVLERMDLRTFRDEDGRELFDVPDAPVARADAPAPVRFLPEYDNAFIAHAGRTRIVPEGQKPWTEVGWGLVLVDGFANARWRLRDGTLAIEPFRKLTRAERDEILPEAESLGAFLEPERATIVRLASRP